MINISKIVIVIALIATNGFSVTPKRADIEPSENLSGNEIFLGKPIPCLGSRSPGDQIGTTYYDYQANGSFGQRLDVDDLGQAHIDWMKMDAGATQRFCAWNARLSDGSYYGETQACFSWTGYVQLDITRDANPGDQRTIIDFHEYGATFHSWIDIDAGNLWGMWPNDPKSLNNLYSVWPYISVANNGNIIMATGDYNVDAIHLYVTTDVGTNWTLIADFDSCGTLSQFLRASENTGSNKVAFVHTQYITDQPNVQLDNDVYYMLSTDGGVTWGPHTNITNYATGDTVRAYCSVNAVFDQNDHLHIAWAGRRCTYPDMWEASHIFHWDEVSNTITQVSSPSTYYINDWWIATATSPSPGAWRMPADQPQLVVDETTGALYCLWHGNDDYNDGSAAGYFNGELYGSKSIDGGSTWTPYTNLTNTRTPGGGSGACDDEDYMTACPKVVNDSIFVSYIEDKDSGGYPQTEGVMTQNPVRFWAFPKTLIGVVEQASETPKFTGLEVFPNPASSRSTVSYSLARPSDVSVALYDVAGRLVRNLDTGYRDAGVYNVSIVAENLANGTYFVVLETSTEDITNSLVIMH